MNRKLPTLQEVGDLKKDKFVVLFDWTWHTQQSINNAPFNTTEYLVSDPKAKEDYNNPVCPKKNSPWLWAELMFGYYLDKDDWVLLKHAEML